MPPKTRSVSVRFTSVGIPARFLHYVEWERKDVIAIPPLLLDELERHYQRTAYKAHDDRVFCHKLRGTVYSSEIWRPLFDAALKEAGIEGRDRIRPFHDLRTRQSRTGRRQG